MSGSTEAEEKLPEASDLLGSLSKISREFGSCWVNPRCKHTDGNWHEVHCLQSGGGVETLKEGNHGFPWPGDQDFRRMKVWKSGGGDPTSSQKLNLATYWPFDGMDVLKVTTGQKPQTVIIKSGPRWNPKVQVEAGQGRAGWVGCGQVGRKVKRQK